MDTPIKAIIIEDEQCSKQLLETVIKKYIKDVEIIGLAESTIGGINLIKTRQPDLVFLDIELSDGTGFEVLDACCDDEFKVIFVTAYNQYAIKAIKYSAIDYLLKPLNIDELEIAIEKAKHLINPQ